jgi:hypothetical protein
MSPNIVAERRKEVSVDSAGRLPTNSSSLVTRLAIAASLA